MANKRLVRTRFCAPLLMPSVTRNGISMIIVYGIKEHLNPINSYPRHTGLTRADP